MYLKDLHAFRGFAIFNIVMAHTGGVLIVFQYFMMGKVKTPAWENSVGVSEMLFHDSTLYFSLISGLLFSAVLAKKGWNTFFKSKLLYVILPYIVMSLLFTVITYSLREQSLLVYPFDSFAEFLSTLGNNIVDGTAYSQFWYIPTLAALYLLTPLVWYLAQKNQWFLLALGVLPFFLARTATDLSPQTVGYFLGAYSVGVWLGMNYQQSISLLKKWRYLFAGMALVVSVVLFFLARKSDPLSPLGLLMESLFYVQKMSIAALVLVLFNYYQDRIPKIVNLLADYAFPIYFIHFFFVAVFSVNIFKVFTPMLSGPMNFALDIVSVVFVMTGSILFAFIIKKLFGRYSRSIIGA